MAENYRVDFEKSRAALKEVLLQRLPETGDYPTPVNGLVLHRYDSGDAPKPRFYDPVIIVVVQGKKRVRIGAEDIPYGEHTCFVAGVTATMFCSPPVVNPPNRQPWRTLGRSGGKTLNYPEIRL